MKTMSSGYRNILWIALGTGLVLLAPLVAMRYTDEVKWSGFDFLVAGVLLFGTGLAYELMVRRSGNRVYRAAAAVAAVASLLLVWVNLAVGLIGSETNPANLLYGAVLAVGLAGAALSRLRAAGMARTMFAMAITHCLVPPAALAIWRPVWGRDEALQILGVTVLFAALFAGAGWLFRKAGQAAGPVIFS
jgi:hypothetical protein